MLISEDVYYKCYNHSPLNVYWGYNYLVIYNQNYKFVKYYNNINNNNDRSFITVYNPKRFPLSFDYDLKITPENFETKIKSLLIFA